MRGSRPATGEAHERGYAFCGRVDADGQHPSTSCSACSTSYDRTPATSRSARASPRATATTPTGTSRRRPGASGSACCRRRCTSASGSRFHDPDERDGRRQPERHARDGGAVRERRARGRGAPAPDARPACAWRRSRCTCASGARRVEAAGQARRSSSCSRSSARSSSSAGGDGAGREGVARPRRPRLLRRRPGRAAPGLRGTPRPGRRDRDDGGRGSPLRVGARPGHPVGGRARWRRLARRVRRGRGRPRRADDRGEHGERAQRLRHTGVKVRSASPARVARRVVAGARRCGRCTAPALDRGSQDLVDLSAPGVWYAMIGTKLQGGGIVAYRMSGTYFESCNCEVTCPCGASNLALPATYDRCLVLLAFRHPVGGRRRRRRRREHRGDVRGCPQADDRRRLAGRVDHRRERFGGQRLPSSSPFSAEVARRARIFSYSSTSRRGPGEKYAPIEYMDERSIATRCAWAARVGLEIEDFAAADEGERELAVSRHRSPASETHGSCPDSRRSTIRRYSAWKSAGATIRVERPRRHSPELRSRGSRRGPHPRAPGRRALIIVAILLEGRSSLPSSSPSTVCETRERRPEHRSRLRWVVPRRLGDDDGGNDLPSAGPAAVLYARSLDRRRPARHPRYRRRCSSSATSPHGRRSESSRTSSSAC